ncbi:MAG: RNA-binding transcriptional accessory protein, partial [Candidatus Competibacteraceae bacterium]|nr:RNA-binding transcriptional accessory protein [Candidatus Competibacteraceae bacterium]
MTINTLLAEEVNARPQQIDAAVQLLDDGATVPFIARYRKEITGGLDDGQLRVLAERLVYLRELEDRRQVILASIKEQGKLDADLQASILAADSKTRLEDLYLPYRPKRRTKAQMAREAGLEPLALGLLAQPEQAPEQAALAYIDAAKGVADVKAALEGARHILTEHFAEDAELLGQLREYLWTHGVLNSTVVADKAAQGSKFADYFEYSEAIRKIPSHRALALFRGRNEGILTLSLNVPEDPETGANPCEQRIARRFGVSAQGRPADNWLLETVRWAWRVKISLHLDLELKQRLRENAEAEAIQVFAHNLRDLLLAAPAGPRPTMGLDPGLRTGVKVAVVDATGKLVATSTIYPHAPQKRWDEALHTLAELARQHAVELISIGNGTASRETDQLAAELIKQQPQLRLQKMMVSEAGASVYSASELAAREMPDIDVSLRGAVSIARRLQDPLAELVKIDPKSIGVGQYQHDVNQTRLARCLDGVVEDCVNAVGVDVNTASPALLSRVAGLNATLAANIVAYRDEQGAFKQRQQLLKVPRLGAKTFEQAAGFLRIMNGTNPLDRSAVHPEAYPVVERILQACGRPIERVLGDSQLLQTLDPARFTDQRFGLPTVRDIIAELDKPGRDPRPEFKTAHFKEGVETLADLKPDMLLEG